MFCYKTNLLKRRIFFSHKDLFLVSRSYATHLFKLPLSGVIGQNLLPINALSIIIFCGIYIFLQPPEQVIALNHVLTRQSLGNDSAS